MSFRQKNFKSLAPYADSSPASEIRAAHPAGQGLLREVMILLALLFALVIVASGCASPQTSCLVNANWRSAQGYDVHAANDGGGALKLPGGL